MEFQVSFNNFAVMGGSASVISKLETQRPAFFLVVDDKVIDTCSCCTEYSSVRKVLVQYIRSGEWQQKVFEQSFGRNIALVQDPSIASHKEFYDFKVSDKVYDELQLLLSNFRESTPNNSYSLLASEEQTTLFKCNIIHSIIFSIISKAFHQSSYYTTWEEQYSRGELNSRIIDDITVSAQSDSFVLSEPAQKSLILLTSMIGECSNNDFLRTLKTDAWLENLVKIFDNLKFGVSVVDVTDVELGNRIVFVNKRLGSMLGHDLIAQSFLELFNGCTQNELCLIDKAIKSAKVLKIGLKCKKKNNNEFLKLLSLIPVFKYGAYRFMVSLHFDATESGVSRDTLKHMSDFEALAPLIFKFPEDCNH